MNASVGDFDYFGYGETFHEAAMYLNNWLVYHNGKEWTLKEYKKQNGKITYCIITNDTDNMSGITKLNIRKVVGMENNGIWKVSLQTEEQIRKQQIKEEKECEIQKPSFFSRLINHKNYEYQSVAVDKTRN